MARLTSRPDGRQGCYRAEILFQRLGEGQQNETRVRTEEVGGVGGVERRLVGSVMELFYRGLGSARCLDLERNQILALEMIEV